MDIDDQTPSTVRDIQALAVAGIEHHTDVDGVPFVVVPTGYEVQRVEDTLMLPTRARGTVTVRDVASFIAVVKDYLRDCTRLYRTVQPPRFVAVFDDHAADQPRWGQHRAVYDCPVSPEWATWTKANKVPMDQATFAQFIEDNLPDIAEPPAADMLEVSRTLQAKKKVAFASGIRLDNGQQQLTYAEQIEGSAGAKGQLRVPEVFTIGVPVFEGGPRYGVKCRLRYRISDAGALALWYDIERPHKVLEHAVDELRAKVEADTGRATINGTPAEQRA
jgi:uncharacterized protein YfdQ (DUF2303 family)